MKKALLPLLLCFILILSACGKQSAEDKGAAPKSAVDPEDKTITYQSEDGPVEVPAHPERVIVLSTYAGNVISLGVTLVGVDVWSKKSPIFEKDLKAVAEVSDENLEKIIELNPDLIIGLSGSDIKNLDKLKQIAPTVTFTYGKLDYLTQHLEIGKLLNKEQEAIAWVDDFKQRTEKSGEKIKAKIGENATVSVIENDDKQLYVFGDNWGRGTEILYQKMKLNMPSRVKEVALKKGYYAISSEVLSEFVGDYVIFSKDREGDTSFAFQETSTYKNIPAVKNHHVFEVNARAFYFSDPISLDYQLKFFEQSFLGE